MKREFVINETEEFRNLVIRTGDDEGKLPRKININDLCARVRYKLGNTIEEDCNYDGTYMLGVMNEVGGRYPMIFPLTYQ